MHPTANTISDRTVRIALRPGEGVAGSHVSIVDGSDRPPDPSSGLDVATYILTFVSLQEPSRLHSSPFTLRTYLFPICGEDCGRLTNFDISFIECASDRHSFNFVCKISVIMLQNV